MRPKGHQTTGKGDLFRARLDQIIKLTEARPLQRYVRFHQLRTYRYKRLGPEW